jgi:hypothetical protein
MVETEDRSHVKKRTVETGAHVPRLQTHFF